MRTEWQCEDFDDAVSKMRALEELGFCYVFHADMKEIQTALGNGLQATYVISLLPSEED